MYICTCVCVYLYKADSREGRRELSIDYVWIGGKGEEERELKQRKVEREIMNEGSGESREGCTHFN